MKPFGAKSAVPFVLAAVLGLCACGNTAPTVSAINVEKELAERFSITDSNKYLLDDSLQDVYKKEEKDGVSLEVLQVIAYDSMLRYLAKVTFDEELVKPDEMESVGIKCNISAENRMFLYGPSSWETTKRKDEKNSVIYICTNLFDKPEIEEGMVLNFFVTEVYQRIEDIPPEALDENGGLREGFEMEKTIWKAEEPLAVSWTVEKLGRSIETEIDNEDVTDGKISLTPMYVHVWANGSNYIPYFYSDILSGNEDMNYFYKSYLRETFFRKVRLKHKDGYYIDSFTNVSPDIYRLGDTMGSFNVLKPFFIPIDPDLVESVEIMGVNYDLKSKE